jgi:hypothetical protein
MCQVSTADPTEIPGDRLAMLRPMLVEQARTHFDAVGAVMKQANSMSDLDYDFMKAMPLLVAILVQANRRGLTDEQILAILRIESEDDELRALAQLRDLARRGAQGEDTDQQATAKWLLRWLDDPAEAAQSILVLMGAYRFLNAALQHPLGGS